MEAVFVATPEALATSTKRGRRLALDFLGLVPFVIEEDPQLSM
jgi:hypothetical protein